MINKSKFATLLSLSLFAVGLIFVSGHFSEATAQRDPFDKPGWAKTKDPRRSGPTGPGGKIGSGPVVDLGLPAIEQRIAYYKRVREDAAANGQPLPKVTSVLTVNEMAVTGIFKTPRGYAAIVEATPIRLSYTIYPGDRFFDGQLVAVEENRVVFRRVTKMSNGKFATSVENKALRQYSDREQIQGTAPVQADAKADAPAQPLSPSGTDPKVAARPIVSPMDEMNKQSAKDAAGSTSTKASKKPVKVAKKQ